MSRSPRCGWGFLCVIATLFCVSLLGCGDDGVPSTVAESASPPDAATLDEELPSPAEPATPAASVDSPDSGTQASSTDPTPASAGTPSPVQLLPQEAETEVTPPRAASPAPDENAGAAVQAALEKSLLGPAQARLDAEKAELEAKKDEQLAELEREKNEKVDKAKGKLEDKLGDALGGFFGEKKKKKDGDG